MITSSESTGLLLKAIHAAKSGMRPIVKDAYNTFHGYKYATALGWWQALKPAMDENGLNLFVSPGEIVSESSRITAGGKSEYNVKICGSARLYHISGEWIEIRCLGDGQDNADKATYKAITGMRKYIYACMFDLPTTDDPETDAGLDNSSPARPRQQDATGRIQDGLRLISQAESVERVQFLVGHALTQIPGITDSQAADIRRAASAREAQLAQAV